MLEVAIEQTQRHLLRAARTVARAHEQDVRFRISHGKNVLVVVQNRRHSNCAQENAAGDDDESFDGPVLRRT